MILAGLRACRVLISTNAGTCIITIPSTYPSPKLRRRLTLDNRVQFGLLSSHSRLHGSSSYRVPWLYDDEACDVLRKFTKLKISLTPYLFACAAAAHECGIPILRPPFLEFPGDRNTWHLDRQYLLGPNLLIAPVFNAFGKVEFYVPSSEDDGDAEWTDLLSGKRYQPGKWYTGNHGFLTRPILIRPNALVVRDTKIGFPEDNIEEGLEVVYGHLTRDVSVKVYDDEAKELGTFEAMVSEGGVDVKGSGGMKGEARSAGIDV